MDPFSYFLFWPVLHDWCNKGCCMCYPVCVIVHIKEPLLLIGKSSPCSSDSRFPLSLSGPLLYIRCHITINKNVLNASLNKTFNKRSLAANHKEPLLLIGKSSPCSSSSRFPLSLNGPLPYVRCHKTMNKNVLNASLNKTFPSFLHCPFMFTSNFYLPILSTEVL